MIYKFTTLLQCFKLEETFIAYLVWMEWYCYNEDTASLSGFDHKQVALLETYMKSTPNFAGAITYQPVYKENIPEFTDDPARGFPAFLIISTGQKTDVDILLCREDGSVQHDYTLEFPIIGKILGLYQEQEQ